MACALGLAEQRYLELANQKQATVTTAKRRGGAGAVGAGTVGTLGAGAGAGEMGAGRGFRVLIYLATDDGAVRRQWGRMAAAGWPSYVELVTMGGGV